MTLDEVTFTAETPHLKTKRKVNIFRVKPGVINVIIDRGETEMYHITGWNPETLDAAKEIACNAFGFWFHEATLAKGDAAGAKRPHCEYVIVKSIAELLVQIAC
jgi:hypothetical protein